MENTKIFVQAFTLREELMKDMEQTLAKVKELGFDGIETMLVPTAKQGKTPGFVWSGELLEKGMDLCSKLGLEVISTHIAFGIGPIRLPQKQVSDFINRVREKYGIRYFIFSGMFEDEKNAVSFGKYLKKIAGDTKESRAVIVCHNHDVELYPYLRDGACVYPMDAFLKAAGEDVKVQLDIGWAGYAGDDEFFYERYKDKIVSIHCKDFRPSSRNYVNRDSLPADAFAPIGEGYIHTREILSAYIEDTEGLRHIAIDQDKHATDLYEELALGLSNIRSFLETPVTRSLPEVRDPVSIDKERLSLMTFSLEFDKSLRKMSVGDIIYLPKENGISYVDLMNIKEKDIPDYITALSENDMKVKCYIANISFLKDDEKIKASLKKQMSIANALKAELFMIVPYGLPTELKGMKEAGKDNILQKMVHGFTLAVEEGKKRGLTVVFETTPHDETGLSSAKDCEYVLRNVPDLKLVYDTANMLPAGDEPLAYYETLKDYVVHVHLKDVLPINEKASLWSETTKDGKVMKCCLWGEGVIPVKDIYEKMINDGYTGFFAIEYAHPDGLHNKEGHSRQLKKQLSCFD